MGRRTVRPSTVISFNTGGGASAEAPPYPARTPVLALDFGSVSALVTTSDSDRVSRADVEFARQLAHEAASFARSLEGGLHLDHEPVNLPDNATTISGTCRAVGRRSSAAVDVVEDMDTPGLHFHGLRHTGNMLAAQSGVGLKDLMARMGHTASEPR